MDALAKIFSSNKTKTNVSPDGGAPDTVGTTVAHTKPLAKDAFRKARDASGLI